MCVKEFGFFLDYGGPRKTRQQYCRSESFAMKTGIPTNRSMVKKPHLIKDGIRIICNTENFVLIVVPGLSASSSSSSPSSTSMTPSRQEIDHPTSSRSLVDSLASKIHANFDVISLDLPKSRTMLTVLTCLAKQSGSHWRFQFLTSILDGLFQFFVHSINEIHPSQLSCGLQMELFIRPLLPLLQLGVPSHCFPDFSLNSVSSGSMK